MASTLTQLDFIGGYELDRGVAQQAEFLNEELLFVKAKRVAEYSTVEKYFNELDYSKLSDYSGYWNSIAPISDEETFRCWLFAFMSVHTSWQANVRGYQTIKDYEPWLDDGELLLAQLTDSRVGMQNSRFRYISEFAQKFWKNPSLYRKTNSESWSEFRNRLMEDTLGLGKAKTTFALELCYPTAAKLTCLDTHMFKAYGLDQTADTNRYYDIERHWVEMSNMWNIPPYIARCIYWDKKQGYEDSRYWSFVLEKN